MSFTYWTDTYWQQYGDPRIANFPLMRTYGPFMAIVGSYLAFVLYLGPRWMQNRAPFQLRRTMQVYNFAMVAINFYFLSKILLNGKFLLPAMFDFDFPANFANRHPQEGEAIFYVYLYLLSKLVDLCDTIIFVLRKRHEQITLLHVYHHASVPLFGWIYARSLATCNLLIPFCILNSMVHVLMYSYYGLAALGPAIQKYLWWKRYITQLQIVQFAILFVYGLYFTLRQRGYSNVLLYNNMLQVMLYIVLFSRFYLKTYKRKNAKSADLSVNSQRLDREIDQKRKD